MSVKLDFAIMTALELRAYILAYQDNEEALQIYLDKRHSENPSPRIYKPEDDVAEAISEYLQNKRQREVSIKLLSLISISLIK